MTSTVVRSAFDAYVNENGPTVNYGDSAKLSLRNQASFHRYSYLHFPLGISQRATVLSASLTVYVMGVWTGTVTVTAKRVTEKWKESTVSYTVPSAAGPNRSATHAASAVIVSGVDKQACIIDVTAIVNDWFTGSANYGFRLESDTTGVSNLYSSESADRTVAPILVVTYVLPPDAPLALAPVGGAAVSTNHPLLLWDSDTPAQIWVQLDNNSDYSSPLIDHGYQASVQQQYDTAPDTALTDNTTYYWRVAFKDANGVASEDFSDSENFQYRSLAVTTITAPSNGGTVTTPTPTITHTLGGTRTQQYVSYILTENGTVVYTREKQPQTATTFVLPAGFVRDTTATYAITVRVWDTFNRQVVGTALDYSEDTNTFTLVTGATAAVTNLVVTAVGGHIHLAWQRSAAPDFFLLRVNGEIIGDPIDPADVLTSALHWGFNFYRALPWKGSADTYEVLALTSGIISGSNPTATLAFEPGGLWLADETTGDEVVVLDKNAVATDIGESGATFYLLGQRAPVRVTDNIRGLEGTISGRLMTTDMMTVGAAHAAFLRLKANTGRTYRLIYGRRNIPVKLGQAHDELDTTGEESYLVSADFFQDSEFEVQWEA